MASNNKSYSNARWWETAEDHRFALEVLQLRLRRDILKFIGCEIRTKGEIANAFCLNVAKTEYHLSLLEKALMVEHTEGCYRAAPTGICYLVMQRQGANPLYPNTWQVDAESAEAV